MNYDLANDHLAELEQLDIETPATVVHATSVSGKPDLGLIMDIPVTLQVVLGSAVMPVAELVKLGRGAVVKLDSKVGEPVDVIVNGRCVARGEIVVLEKEDSRFGITLTEVLSPRARSGRSKGAAA